MLRSCAFVQSWKVECGKVYVLKFANGAVDYGTFIGWHSATQRLLFEIRGQNCFVYCWNLIVATEVK